MRLLQKDLVHPPKETWTSNDSSLSQSLEPNLLERLYAPALGSPAARCGFIKFSPSISTSAPSFCRSPKSSKNTFWPTDLVSRRTLVSLSTKTVGPVSDCAQVLLWQDGCLSRSPTLSRQGGSPQMETGLCLYSSKSTISNPSPCRRQSPRHEADCQARRMDSSALSLSFDFETSDPTRPRKARSQRRKRTRSYLSIDAPSSRGSRRTGSRCLACTIDSVTPNLMRYKTYSSHVKRISTIHKILPSVSNASRIKLTNHNQFRRIHVLHHSRLTQTQSLGFQPSITSQVDNRFNPIPSEINLQWQTSSTDLINSTPKGDSHLLSFCTLRFMRFGNGTLS